MHKCVCECDALYPVLQYECDDLFQALQTNIRTYVHQGRIEPPQCVVYSPHALALGKCFEVVKNAQPCPACDPGSPPYLVRVGESLAQGYRFILPGKKFHESPDILGVNSYYSEHPLPENVATPVFRPL